MTEFVPIPAQLSVEAPRRFALGGMAELFAGEKVFPSGGRAGVVVKRMMPQHAKVPELVSRFRDEARLGMLLRHSNIVRVYEYAEIDGAHYMVMERIDGVDLAAVVKRCRDRGVEMPQEVAAFFLECIASALAYMADAKTADGRPMGLVHRDISPSNILVSHEGVIKLIDFGVAMASEREFRTREGFFVGKYAYMSPEQVRGEAVDIRSDLFALGNVGYELLTGKLPFLGASEFETFNQILDLAASPLSSERVGLHPRLVESVERCLAKPVAERYPHPLEMVRDLRRYFHEAVDEPPPVLAVSFLEDVDLISGAERERELTPSAPGAPIPSTGVGHMPPQLAASGDMPALQPEIAHAEDTFEPTGESESVDDESDSRGHLLGWIVTGAVVALAVCFLCCGVGRWAYRALFVPTDEEIFVEPTTPRPAEDTTPTQDHPSWTDEPVARTGTVNIYSDVETEIFMHKKSIGTTPILGLELEPGRYRLQARNDDLGWSSWVTVSIEGGEEKDIQLEPKAREQATE